MTDVADPPRGGRRPSAADPPFGDLTRAALYKLRCCSYNIAGQPAARHVPRQREPRAGRGRDPVPRHRAVARRHGDGPRPRPRLRPAGGGRLRPHDARGPRRAGRAGDRRVAPGQFGCARGQSIRTTRRWARFHSATAGADAVIAIGSGTINDLCKYASAADRKPYAVFATAPSMNGYTSLNAAITDTATRCRCRRRRRRASSSTCRSCRRRPSD